MFEFEIMSGERCKCNTAGILGHKDKAFAMAACSGDHSRCYKDDGTW